MKVLNNFKIWIVITLTVIAAGMFVLGFVGLNNPVDYKTSYQVEISVEEDLNGSIQIAMDTAESFFATKGISDKSYSFEMRDNGSVCYKFTTDVSDAVQGLESAIQTKLDIIKRQYNTEGQEEVPAAACGEEEAGRCLEPRDRKAGGFCDEGWCQDVRKFGKEDGGGHEA